MRHDDLGCQKVRVLDMVDGLAGRFHAQLVGVHVHGGQLRHDAAHPLLGVPADGRAVLAGAGHRGGGAPRCCGDIIAAEQPEVFALQEVNQTAAAPLLGDFNSEVDVRGDGYDLILRSGWQDTYRLAQQRDEGYTVVQAIDGWRDAPDAAAKSALTRSGAPGRQP